MDVEGEAVPASSPNSVAVRWSFLENVRRPERLARQLANRCGSTGRKFGSCLVFMTAGIGVPGFVTPPRMRRGRYTCPSGVLLAWAGTWCLCAPIGLAKRSPQRPPGAVSSLSFRDSCATCNQCAIQLRCSAACASWQCAALNGWYYQLRANRTCWQVIILTK